MNLTPLTVGIGAAVLGFLTAKPKRKRLTKALMFGAIGYFGFQKWPEIKRTIGLPSGS